MGWEGQNWSRTKWGRARLSGRGLRDGCDCMKTATGDIRWAFYICVQAADGLVLVSYTLNSGIIALTPSPPSKDLAITLHLTSFCTGWFVAECEALRRLGERDVKERCELKVSQSMVSSAPSVSCWRRKIRNWTAGISFLFGLKHLPMRSFFWCVQSSVSGHFLDVHLVCVFGHQWGDLH